MSRLVVFTRPVLHKPRGNLRPVFLLAPPAPVKGTHWFPSKETQVTESAIRERRGGPTLQYLKTLFIRAAGFFDASMQSP